MIKHEKQEKLLFQEDHSDNEEIYKGKRPEVKIIVNNYISAGALIREKIIKKLWVIPASRITA